MPAVREEAGAAEAEAVAHRATEELGWEVNAEEATDPGIRRHIQGSAR